MCHELLCVDLGPGDSGYLIGVRRYAADSLGTESTVVDTRMSDHEICCGWIDVGLQLFHSQGSYGSVRCPELNVQFEYLLSIYSGMHSIGRKSLPQVPFDVHIPQGQVQA